MLLAGALLLAGCATPASRIEKNRAAFDQATPAQQELIKQGKVALGFDQELVELALGAPDRIWERTDQHGQTIIWTYTTYETPDGALLYRGWYHRWWGAPDCLYYTDYTDRREHERLRISFTDGKVVSIEQEK